MTEEMQDFSDLELEWEIQEFNEDDDSSEDYLSEDYEESDDEYQARLEVMWDKWDNNI